MTSPTPPPTPPPEPDAQVHLSEEYDSFKHTLPSAVPVAIAMLFVVVVIGIVAYVLRAKPVISGSIDGALAVTIPNQNRSLAIVNLSFQNVTEKPLRLTNINVAVHAKGADFNDNFGSTADFPRYFEAFPALEQYSRRGIVRDTKVAPMEAVLGSVIVSFPLTQEEFDARDSLTVTLKFADYAPAKITSGKKQ